MELAAIEGEDDFTPLGIVPRTWLQSRMIGSARGRGRFADVYGEAWTGCLRNELTNKCVELSLAEIDPSALRRAAPRWLTQQISRIAYDKGFNGIYYFSKYDADVENWAFFEPFTIDPKCDNVIDAQDPELESALQVLGLKLESAPIVY